MRTEIDLRQHLNISTNLGSSFNCPFHDDKNPSATINIGPDGSYRFLCMSSNCSFSNDKGLDIVDLTKLIENCDTSSALKYLNEMYNIKTVNIDWVNKEKKKYDQNMQLIMNTEKFKESLPYTHRLIRYSYKLLLKLNKLAIDNLHYDIFNVDNKSIFFVSNRYLAKVLIKNKDKVNKYINLYCVLGLLEKIPTDKIEKRMLKNAINIAKTNGQNRICFYTIPKILDKISEIEMNAQLLCENRFSLQGMTKKYIENLFGRDFANNIYQVKVKESIDRELIRKKIEQLVLTKLYHYKYCTKDMILNEVIIFNNKTLSRNTKEYEFKRVLPKLLKENDLIYIKANNRINDLLGIETRKYIMIEKHNQL